MPVLSTASLLALVLHTGTSAAAWPQLPDCAASPSRIELPADPTDHVLEVCISTERPTTFHFDSPLAPGAVELQDRERFEDVSVGARSFTVLPPINLQPGERFKVVVPFPDGAAPTRATFMLVGHPALGARQVDVFRHKRTVEDYQREVREERSKFEQLAQELERLRLENGPGGLTGLLAAGVMTLDNQGVKAEELTRSTTQFASNALHIRWAYSYRSTTNRVGVVRVAVAVKLENLGTLPWTIKDAALVGKGQEVRPVKVLWQPSPILPGEEEPGVVVMEWELTAREAQGLFTLKMWDESGSRLVTIGHVTFP